MSFSELHKKPKAREWGSGPPMSHPKRCIWQGGEVNTWTSDEQEGNLRNPKHAHDRKNFSYFANVLAMVTMTEQKMGGDDVHFGTF